MKPQVTHQIGKTTITIGYDDSVSGIEVFEALANAEDIFGNAICGACGGQEVLHVARKKDDYTFYEIVCQNTKCKAKLDFYSNGEQFFAKRKNKDGSWKPNGGWEVWRKDAPETPSFKPKRQPAASHNDRDDSPF